jgi:hypothetical protein
MNFTHSNINGDFAHIHFINSEALTAVTLKMIFNDGTFPWLVCH